jgi:hypothetical protein
LECGQTKVDLAPDKRYRLLAYLAYAADWVGRDRLAYLFWPEFPYNAVVELFFATLTTEEIESVDYETCQQAKISNVSYLEGFYNSRRQHSSLGSLSSDDFEQALLIP